MRYERALLVSPRFYKGRFRLAVHPLAGLGYIAEALTRAGVSVTTLDMNLHYTFSDLRRRIHEFEPDILGFTVMTFGHKDTYETINMIKRLNPAIRIAAGGPHISTMRENALEDCEGLDYGIILEGDRTFTELCRGEDPCRIKGMIYRKDGRIVKNEFGDFLTDLDGLSFPRYESFELGKYPTGQIGIVTSRGCPFNCIYCPVVSAIGKHFRCRSAESVVDEIDYWYRKGYREMLVLDDNFTLSRKRTEAICDLLGKKDYKGISLKCPNGIRADMADFDLLRQMKRAGFGMVAFGVEAAENRVLKKIKKGEDIETIEKAISDACKLGFDVDLFFLIGSPGERMEDFKSSLSLASRYPIRNANFYNIIPFPTTELFKWIDDNGYFIRPRDYIIDEASLLINEPCFFTPEMSAEARKLAFKMGQKVSRSVRRKFIEGKIMLPLLWRKALSWFYTNGFVEMALVNSHLLIKLKEKAKRSIFEKRKALSS